MVWEKYIRRWSVLTLCAIVMPLLGACMGQPSIALTGTVTDAYTGKPVPDTKLKLGRSEATTDTAGKYQFASWTLKDTLDINAPGYEAVQVALATQPQLEKAAPPTATLDTTLRPNMLSGTITDLYSGKPLAGAEVQVSDQIRATTGEDGRYTLNGVPEAATVVVKAPDHEAFEKAVSRTTSLDASLRPNVLAGVVIDEKTGSPVSGAKVQAGTASATTGADGRYRLEGVPEGASLQISAPGYAGVEQSAVKDATYDAKLQPDTLTGKITDQLSGAPLAGATVKAGEATTTTGKDGTYQLEGVTGTTTIVIRADGYAPITQTVKDLAPLDVALRSSLLEGTLIDATTKAPIKNATVIATTSLSTTNVAFTRIDNSTDGHWRLTDAPEQGYLQVLSPGYAKKVIPIKPGEVPATIALEPFEVKALYVTAAIASRSDLLPEYLDLIDRTELNSIIIDLKSDLRDDLGLVYYSSQTPMVKELGTSKDYMDLPAILADLKKRGIYSIARIQLFSHDNVLADARPAWAIQDKETGKVYADYPGPGIRYAWLDPWNRNVWKYNIDLGVEAALLGFDEVNFDYVRYPDAERSTLATYKDLYGFSQPTDPKNDPEAMYNNLAEFLKEAQHEINGAGAYISADLFGRVVLGPSAPISQDIARMAPYTDYIAPMIYPSLWWPSYLGFSNPTAHPYEVILGSLKSASEFFEGKRALLRPWLQGGTDPWQGSRTVEYGTKELRAQADATEDSGVAHGWMFYNSANSYPDDAFKLEK